MSWRKRHANAVFLRDVDADRLIRASRYEIRISPGATVTAISPRPDGYTMTFHRVAELPWNARRKPIRPQARCKRSK